MIGVALQKAFNISSQRACGEIQLFRAFIQAFNTIGPNALAHEYHGNRYQVTFSANRGAGRSTPRCELCDVMIIHYPAGNPTAARFTFNQMKVSNNTLSHIPNVSTLYKFRANLEQWDLLSSRPSINATSVKIHLPNNLLSIATLPSVGTFGVFYPKNLGFDFAYFVANKLKPLNNNVNRSGTLQWNELFGKIHKINNYNEITATCCMCAFGNCLEYGLIGTPLLPYLSCLDKNGLAWLYRVLSQLRTMYPHSDLPKDLINGLELVHEEPLNNFKPITPRAVVLVKTGIISP